MGDVMGILNEAGTEIVTYRYDSWGNVLYSTTNTNSSEDYYMAQYNPMKYRSYYQDEDTNMYYLQSRYYMPSIYRFLNADIPDIAQQSKAEINGLNLFAYCNNDPVNNVDPSGYYKAFYIYVIYDGKHYTTQAKHEARFWKEKSKKNIVFMYAPTSVERFVNYWNNTVSNNSTVVIISHGEPNWLGIGGDFYKKDVTRLKNKNLNALYIYACNCGHKDVKDNIANRFKNRLTKTNKVYAMDGSISYYPLGHYFDYKYYKPRLSTNQSHYYTNARMICYQLCDYRYAFSIRPPSGLYRVK